ncbi:MAG: hypothetical protein HQK60_15760 [Deltaproteobacteria bacterium]|nr:hypothetical protein [Deltaproteobacteria bacterium]
MDPKIKFLIRLIVAIPFGVLMMRFFYPKANLVFGIILAGFLLIMAYMMEYLGKKKKPER